MFFFSLVNLWFYFTVIKYMAAVSRFVSPCLMFVKLQQQRVTLKDWFEWSVVITAVHFKGKFLCFLLLKENISNLIILVWKKDCRYVSTEKYKYFFKSSLMPSAQTSCFILDRWNIQPGYPVSEDTIALLLLHFLNVFSTSLPELV